MLGTVRLIVFTTYVVAVVVAAFIFCSEAAADDKTTCASGSGDVMIAACSREIQRNPKDVSALINRGAEYVLPKGDFDRGISDLNQALAIGGLSPFGLTAAYSNRGNAYLGKGQYDRAISDYNEAIRRTPNHPYSLLGRGVAKIKKGDVNGGNADIAAAKAIRADVAKEWMTDWEPVDRSLVAIISERQ